jgi:hypothetical protein
VRASWNSARALGAHGVVRVAVRAKGHQSAINLVYASSERVARLIHALISRSCFWSSVVFF